MLSTEAVSKIQRYVESGMQPRTDAVLSDAFVLWWDTADLEDADFCIIYRRGNCSRAFQINGRWQLVKGLGTKDNGPFAWDTWETNGLPSAGSIRELAQLMWLPDKETLSFLPLALQRKGRRHMICGDKLFMFIPDDNGFFLELKGARSPLFGGEPWKSTNAADWASKFSKSDGAPVSAESALAQVAMASAGETVLSDLWGMF